MVDSKPVKLLVLLFTLILTGCVSFTQLSKEFSYSNLGDESVIVLGVEPRFRTQISKGDDRPDGWHRNNVAVTLNTFPENGYIVAKLPARSNGQDYGIAGVLPEGIGGKVYSPCEGQETVTFMAPPGGVVYVGSISFENNSGNLSFKITEDLDKAREFMKNEYPSLAEHIVLEKPSIKK